MRVASILTFMASATAMTNVTLVSNSTNHKVNGLELVDLHEGAGFQYFFLNSTGGVYSYDSSRNSPVFETFEESGSDEQYTMNLSVSSSPWTSKNLENDNAYALYIGVVDLSSDTSVISVNSDSHLSINGTSAGFFAAKDTLDSYHYSQEYYQVFFSPDGAPSGTIPLKIQVNEAYSNISVVSSTGGASANNSTVQQSSTSSGSDDPLTTADVTAILSTGTTAVGTSSQESDDLGGGQTATVGYLFTSTSHAQSSGSQSVSPSSTTMSESTAANNNSRPKRDVSAAVTAAAAAVAALVAALF